LKLILINNYEDFSNFRSTCSYIYRITLTWTDRWKEYIIIAIQQNNDNSVIPDNLIQFYMEYYNKIQLPLPEQIRRLSTAKIIQIERFISYSSDTLLIIQTETLGVLIRLITKILGNVVINLIGKGEALNINYLFDVTVVIDNELLLCREVCMCGCINYLDALIPLSTPINEIASEELISFCEALSCYCYYVMK
jgi:hypothetical protein